MNNIDDRIEDAITRRMAQAKGSVYRPMDELEWLSYKRRHTKRQLDASRQRLVDSYHQLTSPSPAPQTKWDYLMLALDKSTTIFKGARMGIRIVDAIRTVVDLRQLFRRRK